MQCSAVQCSAVQCSAVQCSAVQCSAVQCSAVQCSAVQCSAVQCSAVQNIITLTVPNNSLFTDNVWIINVLNLVGKFFCTIVAFLIWTYTCEVYPTALRNQGLTLTSVGARLSSVFATYIGFLVSKDTNISNG